jgi:hypothetical protein
MSADMPPSSGNIDPVAAAITAKDEAPSQPRIVDSARDYALCGGDRN